MENLSIFWRTTSLKDLFSRWDKTRKFDLKNRLIEFTIKIANVVESLRDNKVAYYLGAPSLRSGSSLLNYGEAQGSRIQEGIYTQIKNNFESVKRNEHLPGIAKSKVISYR